MAALSLPSLDTIKAAIIAIHKAARPSADDAWGSDLWLEARKLGRAVLRLHQTAERVLNALFPSTTFGDYLDSWLRLVGAPDGLGGYGRIKLRGSTGTDAAALVSVGAGPWADVYHQQGTDTAGNIYQISEHYTPVAATTQNVDIEAVSKGSATNLETGAVITLSSPPAGITAAMTLVADLDDGADAETDAEGRARLAAWMRDPPCSGNVADWTKAIESASPGALQPYVWLERNNYPTGYGLVDYAALQLDEYGSAQSIAPASALGLKIQAAVEAQLPVLLMKQARMLTVNPVTTTTVEISLTMSDWASESDLCDWDAETPQYDATAVTVGTLTVQANAGTVGAYIAAGDRVIIDGAQAVVTASGVTAVDEFQVDAWFSVYDADKNPYPWPTTGHGAGRAIYSGGGRILAVVGALREYAAGIGPSKDASTGADAIAEWDDTIRVNAVMSCAIVAAEGRVVDVAVTSPGADWAPATLDTATTNRVVPGEIVVWEVK